MDGVIGSPFDAVHRVTARFEHGLVDHGVREDVTDPRGLGDSAGGHHFRDTGRAVGQARGVPAALVIHCACSAGSSVGHSVLLLAPWPILGCQK